MWEKRERLRNEVLLKRLRIRISSIDHYSPDQATATNKYVQGIFCTTRDHFM